MVINNEIDLLTGKLIVQPLKNAHNLKLNILNEEPKQANCKINMPHYSYGESGFCI